MLASSYPGLDGVARLAIEVVYVLDILNDKPLYDRCQNDLTSVLA